MDAVLSLYEAMSQVSDRMVLAAQNNDWDALTELEQESAELRNRLLVEDPPHSMQSLDETVRARKLELIQKLLKDHEEIRFHADPWLESVKALLAGNARQKAVQNAYGA